MSIESIRPQLDDETCKKLAVWLCDNALKTTSYYIQETYEALKDYAEKGMTEDILGSMREAMHRPDMTEREATILTEGELRRGIKQLQIWADRPRDTNARFFRLKYNQVNWEA